MNAPAGYVQLVSIGKWDEQIIEKFAQGTARAIAEIVRAGVPYGQIRSLLDIREAGISVQSLASATPGLVAKFAPACERVALLESSMLQKLQYRRLITGDAFQHFDDLPSASAWLMEGWTRVFEQRSPSHGLAAS